MLRSMHFVIQNCMLCKISKKNFIIGDIIIIKKIVAPLLCMIFPSE